MSRFEDYARAGFGDDLLPILPHDAVIHPDSPGRTGLEQKKGKVPGRKFAGGWFGFKDWTDYFANPGQFPRWAGWGAGVGMQGRRFPALDIDVDDGELADAIFKEATHTLGAAPVRFGRGSRRILVYAGANLTKRRLAFRRAGLHSQADDGQGARAGGAHTRGRDDVLDQAAELRGSPASAGVAAGVATGVQAVEFLATGQQYVVEGVHPGTGEPYYWLDDHAPTVRGAAGLVPVTAAAIDAFLDRVEGLVELFGYEVEGRSAGAGAGHGVGSVWQDGLIAPSLEAVGRAIAALPNDVGYDDWIKVGIAIKAACGPDHDADALGLFTDWSLLWPENQAEQVHDKWTTLHAPYRIGWDFLSDFATSHGDGSFYGAHEDFDAVAPTPGNEAEAREAKGPLAALFDRWVWVERLKRMCDLQTGDLLDREQFNIRNSHIGNPHSAKECAWVVLTSHTARLQTVKTVTYRPGQGVFVNEDLPGLNGRCVNTWRDPCVNLPASASRDDVSRWLELVEFVVPNAAERETVLDWLAWIIQNPGLKPNWALVIGSTYEGIGKDLMLEPVRVALGAGNVREISPDDLDSQYTWFLARCRLVLVEEMKLSERKATMNRLKPLVAAPPYTLTVNAKFEPQYEIPNIIASVFFTNVENALAISQQGRRYFVTWNDGQPRLAEYYKGLVAWYRSGGAALAARWLLSRDVSDFEAQGRAPESGAKEDMRRAARSLLEEWLEDSIADGAAPFDTDIVALEDVLARLPDYVMGRGRPTGQRLSAALKRLGCVYLGRVRLGRVPANMASDRAALWAVRRAENVVHLSAPTLRDRYLDQVAQGAVKAAEMFQ